MSKEYRKTYLCPIKPLPEEVKQKIIVLSDKLDIEKIERSCMSYLGQRDQREARDSQKMVQVKLKEIHDCAKRLKELLDEQDIQEALDNCVQAHTYMLVTEGRRLSAVESELKRDRNYKNIRGSLGGIEVVTRGFEALASKKGRPRGGRNKPAYNLCNALYKCCRDAGIRPTFGTKGILHQLLDVLREHLEIGHGEYERIIRAS